MAVTTVYKSMESFEDFNESLGNCCNTLMVCAEPIYEMAINHCRKVQITFTFEPNSLITMDTKVSTIVTDLGQDY